MPHGQEGAAVGVVVNTPAIRGKVIPDNIILDD
jgi:hypothetical protein